MRLALACTLLGLSTAAASLATPCRAQEGGDAERIRALETEVADLRRMVGDLAQASRTPAVSAMHHDDTTGLPTLEIHGFGHFQYDAFWDDFDTGGSDVNSHFTNGGLDLLLTSQLADKLSFVNETVFEFEDEGENVLDVERLLLRYEYADWLRAAIGRGHTALGYWNHRFHHGSWLQTTVERPLLFSFEDEGGILPVHYVGLELSGELPVGESSISYVANLANGRGRITDSVQLVEDRNDGKMVSFMFTWHPGASEALGFGANVMFDHIPVDPDVSGRGHQIDEKIAGLHAYYTEQPWEVLGELQVIDHQDDGPSGSSLHWGGYLQLAYQVGRLKPYYRFDWLQIDPGDLFFAGLEGVEDTLQHTLGVRWDWTTFAAWKFELRRRDSDSFDAVEAAAQISFAF